MIDQSEAGGLGIAAVGHLILLAGLSLGFAPVTPPPTVNPMEVSFVEEVALLSAAPSAAVEPPAASSVPETSLPQEELLSEPMPAEVSSAPPPPRKAEERPALEPALDKRAPRPTPLKAKPPAKRSNPANRAIATRRSPLGKDFLKNLGADPVSKSSQPVAATMSRQASVDIASAILRQVQPCANQQVNPGPGAEKIRVTINLKLNPNGSLRAPPRVTGRSGVDESNRRYAERVEELAIATFKGCSPLRGLPTELYDVSNGWKDFSLRYKLPG